MIESELFKGILLTYGILTLSLFVFIVLMELITTRPHESMRKEGESGIRTLTTIFAYSAAWPVFIVVFVLAWLFLPE